MVNWSKFPSTLDQAKSESIKWINLFHESKPYDGLKISIYFHLEKKTIRFELIKSNGIIVDLKSEQDPIDYILNFNYLDSKEIIFKSDKTNFFNESISIDKCKEVGKNLSTQLEEKYSENKFVVFLNPNKKTIKIKVK